MRCAALCTSLALALFAPSGAAVNAAAAAAHRAQHTARIPEPFAQDPYPSTYRPLPRSDTLITHATVLDGAGRRLQDADVLLRDGKVVAIGRGLSGPRGVRVVVARGRWVTPGIIDVHSHLGDFSAPYTSQELDHSDVNEISSPNTANVWAEHSINVQDPGFSAVLSRSIPLAVLAARESDIRQAIRLADDFNLRVVVFGGAEAWRAARDLAAHHIPVVLNPFDDMPATFDEMGARLQNAALLQKAGVTVAFSVPGIHFSHDAGEALREAAGLAVANGLPWIEALKAVTVNAAGIWGIADHYGTIAVGRDADLVIWDGDPLEPASSPTTVLVAGRIVSLLTRQELLEERYAPRRKPRPLPPAYYK